MKRSIVTLLFLSFFLSACGQTQKSGDSDEAVDLSSQGANRLARTGYRNLVQNGYIDIGFNPSILSIEEGSFEDQFAPYPEPIAIPQPVGEYDPSFVRANDRTFVSLADVDGDGFLDVVAAFPQGIFVSRCVPRIGCDRFRRIQSIPSAFDSAWGEGPSYFQFDGQAGNYGLRPRNQSDRFPLR